MNQPLIDQLLALRQIDIDIRSRLLDERKLYGDYASAMRFFFVGTVIWVGIWLTGFSTAHWLFYLPAAFYYFAAISGICLGIIISRLLFKG